MLFSEILSGHRLNVVNVACADCGFSIMTTVAIFISKWCMSSFLTSMLYKLEKGKHHLGVEYCSKYFCSRSFLLSEKVLKDCIALFGVGVNKISCMCVFWQENNLNVKVSKCILNWFLICWPHTSRWGTGAWLGWVVCLYTSVLLFAFWCNTSSSFPIILLLSVSTW